MDFAQASLKLQGSSDPSASATQVAGTTWGYHCALFNTYKSFDFWNKIPINIVEQVCVFPQGDNFPRSSKSIRFGCYHDNSLSSNFSYLGHLAEVNTGSFISILLTNINSHIIYLQVYMQIYGLTVPACLHAYTWINFPDMSTCMYMDYRMNTSYKESMFKRLQQWTEGVLV